MQKKPSKLLIGRKFLQLFLVYFKYYTYLCSMKNYFTVAELTQSDTAKKFKIDNTPSAEIKMHMKELIEKLLNPIREAWGSSIIVSSGYRCPELNAKVGGAKTSAHLTGYAADLIPGNGKRAQFIKFVQDFLRKSNIPFDQCINEYNRWCHVGLYGSFKKQRKQVFRIY